MSNKPTLKNWNPSRYTTYSHVVTVSEGSMSTQSIDADGPLTLLRTKQTATWSGYKVYGAPTGTKAIVTTHTAEGNFVKQYIFTEAL
jgi:hypothetical protein